LQDIVNGEGSGSENSDLDQQVVESDSSEDEVITAIVFWNRLTYWILARSKKPNYANIICVSFIGGSSKHHRRCTFEVVWGRTSYWIRHKGQEDQEKGKTRQVRFISCKCWWF